MKYLLIKNLNPDNIIIKSNRNSHKIVYKTNHSILTGLSIRLHDIIITESSNEYIITIKDSESIDTIKKIDTNFTSSLNVRPILKNNMIIFKKNEKLNKLIKQYTTSIDIYIFMIKNVAYQTSPIVYIL
jgi:hypothetical protein